MTAVVLIAVIVDRRAVTFRTLAVAAMIVLTLAPDESIDAGARRSRSLAGPSSRCGFSSFVALLILAPQG
jgi:Competence protein